MSMEDLYHLLRTGQAQAQGIVDTIDAPVAVLDRHFNVLDVNPAFCDTFKVKRGDTVGQKIFDLGDGQWNAPEFRKLLNDVLPKAGAVVDYEITRDFPEVGLRTMLVSARRLIQPANTKTSILLQFEDVTERKRADSTRDIFVAETRHRARNLLALARALATQIEAKGVSGEEYRDAFLGRFEALVSAQDLSFEPAPDLATLIAQTVEAFGARRFRVAPGPATPLRPSKVLPIGMVLHELATNAIKYGALSTDRGVVHLAWHVDSTGDHATLHLEWREEGGPRVAPPERLGFGTRLIEYSIKHDLKGSGNLDFRPDGLHATINAPGV